MGKLKVYGKARREFSCDIMFIKLTFGSWHKNISQAVETTLSQCDNFLELLQEKGIDVGNIHIKYSSISQDRDDDGEIEVKSDREIELRLPYDMKFLNRLSEIIGKCSFDVEMDVSFKLSNMIEVHNQLIKEAVIDSRKKAEMIAETMGQKVVGIEELSLDDRYNNFDSEEKEYCAPSINVIGETHSISDKLRSPLCIEYENVEVDWIIE